MFVLLVCRFILTKMLYTWFKRLISVNKWKKYWMTKSVGLI
ncbi:hypothetical protein BOVA604_4266 [Bacteroides ovatus]|nr:hypothetical protein BOVA604_4266 [Bacteroides ovatus]